jgi:hypothetical protein
VLSHPEVVAGGWLGGRAGEEVGRRCWLCNCLLRAVLAVSAVRHSS